ncbi:N-carbamoylputrescine amidase [Pigmentibacter sp. JX0631]|uniref:N-carbamoylputrescine amidase n=1 Tax=Pigmentibacter sp. JX0631 TaxID=2976982 RepID=UPI0024684FB1|nr:N-carbamoylputrescine amidase [Pigmentibacter sp. JX0631]WGL61061.1 N-carbamoylputrescine amidase [Pigmentibacter sp. JX0631]
MLSNVVKLAIIQMQMSNNLEENIKKATDFIKNAVINNAKIILLPELFENHYFCQEQYDHLFSLASPVTNHPFLSHFQSIAKEYNVVLPISFFEKAGQAYFNSLAMIDASGEILGVYRKTHIPDGPCYQEKYYFNPGDSGFKVWDTKYGKIGVGICWDQWFPESARIMTLLGADLLLYPTAIGSEPPEAHAIDTKDMWQRAMIGHAVCNSVYLAAPNRVGTEKNMTFYGSSFICDYMGNKLTEADKNSETILYAELNLSEASTFRAGMGFFRDRRPEKYKTILSLDGF